MLFRSWVVWYERMEHGPGVFGAPLRFLTADLVVLAAGTLGSSEILLRSAAAGLAVSAQLGQRFTGNGDVLGFGYNNDRAISGVGFGRHAPEGREPVGPCITSMMDLREQPRLEDGLVIEEGSIPGALAALLPLGLHTAALAGHDTDSGVLDRKSTRLNSSHIQKSRMPSSA